MHKATKIFFDISASSILAADYVAMHRKNEADFVTNFTDLIIASGNGNWIEHGQTYTLKTPLSEKSIRSVLQNLQIIPSSMNVTRHLMYKEVNLTF